LYYQTFLFYYFIFFINFLYLNFILQKKALSLRAYKKRLEVGIHRHILFVYKYHFLELKGKNKLIILDYIYRFCFRICSKVNLFLINFGFLFYYYLQDNYFVKKFLKKNILLYRILDFLIFESFSEHMIFGIGIFLLMLIKLLVLKKLVI
jgi:hypothetical protein